MRATAYVPEDRWIDAFCISGCRPRWKVVDVLVSCLAFLGKRDHGIKGNVDYTV